MSDTYQAIYDAVRSRISNGDVGEAMRDVMHRSFDISHITQCIPQDIAHVVSEMTRPSVLMRPRLFMDGNQWCALYGDNLQSGVAGFAMSPDEAMRNFDAAWTAKARAT